jgi:hypothetical protein
MLAGDGTRCSETLCVVNREFCGKRTRNWKRENSVVRLRVAEPTAATIMMRDGVAVVEIKN